MSLNNLKTLCINLPSRSDRRDEMTKKLSDIDLDFSFVDGVLGASKDIEDFPCYNRERRLKYYDDLSKGELGCAEAFCRAFETFLNDHDESYLLLLEDDVIFPARFKSLLGVLISERKGWDCIRLQRSRKQIGPTVETLGEYNLKYPLMTGMNNTGLLMTRDAVNKVLPLFKKHIFAADHVLKFAHFKGVLVYEVDPEILSQDTSKPGDTDTQAKPFKNGISLYRKMIMICYRVIGQGIRLFFMPLALLKWKKVKMIS